MDSQPYKSVSSHQNQTVILSISHRPVKLRGGEKIRRKVPLFLDDSILSHRFEQNGKESPVQKQGSVKGKHGHNQKKYDRLEHRHPETFRSVTNQPLSHFRRRPISI